MTTRVASVKLGAILASLAVSSFAVFGQDAWAPEPVTLTEGLPGSTGATAAAFYSNTHEPTTVLRWPGSWTAGSAVAGRPCSTTTLAPWTETVSVIERQGSYAKCTLWITPGARLTAALSGTGSFASATIFSGEAAGQATTVVRFPASWTYNTTLAAETYFTTWQAPAGAVVGMTIVRAGDFAK
jgi:hypothetical protein